MLITPKITPNTETPNNTQHRITPNTENQNNTQHPITPNTETKSDNNGVADLWVLPSSEEIGPGPRTYLKDLIGRAEYILYKEKGFGRCNYSDILG